MMYADDGLLYSDKPFDPEEILNFPLNSGIRAHKEGVKSKWVKKNGEWIIPLKFTGKKYIPKSLLASEFVDPNNKTFENANVNGGLIVNATKNPKTFIFDKSKAFSLATLFDKWYLLKNKVRKYHSQAGQTITIGNSYGEIKMNDLTHNNHYSGYIDSRIYLGSYHNLPIEDSWKEYKYISNSWSDNINQIESGNQLSKLINLFTASSFANSHFAHYLKVKGLNRTSFKGGKRLSSMYDKPKFEYQSDLLKTLHY